MVYKHVTLAATITVLSQISHVSAWAYGLGILHNQDVTNVDGEGNWIISATSGATCFSDVPAKCGDCGAAYTSPPSASMDITEPGTFNTNTCGNPCVTYNSSGMSFEQIQNAPVNTPAGWLTEHNGGASMGCKVLQSGDCGGLFITAANSVAMYVVCDPSIQEDVAQLTPAASVITPSKPTGA